MISFSICCNSPSLHARRPLFSLTSSPDTATPPAFAALPGAHIILASLTIGTSSRLLGLLAPQLTAMHPFPTCVLTTAPSSSFCVDHRKPNSPFTAHGGLPP